MCGYVHVQVAERHDTILQLKTEYKDLEEKHAEAVATVTHRGEVIVQLRDELKNANMRVRCLLSIDIAVSG